MQICQMYHNSRQKVQVVAASAVQYEHGLTLSFSLILCTNIRGGAGSELGLVGTEDP